MLAKRLFLHSLLTALVVFASCFAGIAQARQAPSDGAPSQGGGAAPAVEAPVPIDFYAKNPHDPAPLIASFKSLINSTLQGDADALPPQLTAQLAQNRKSCRAYAAQGVLSSACCDDLDQASNFVARSNIPERQLASIFLETAGMECSAQSPPSSGPNASPAAP